jgi:hypothetical protein
VNGPVYRDAYRAFSKATFSEGGLLLSIAKLAKILCFLLSFSA